MINIQQVKECPDCASNNITHNLEKEQVICRDCGLIYEPLDPKTEEAFEKAHGIETTTPKKTSKPAKKKKK